MITLWSRGEADNNMPQDILVDVYQKVCLHPWWIARAKLAVALLKDLGIGAGTEVIDVGCGWGTNLVALEKSGYGAVGLDVSLRVLEMIDRPDRRLVEADLNQDLPANAPKYRAALLLDVIEHLDDDRSVLSRVAQLLQPGGTVIVSVPALPELFSEFDEIQGHRRRYVPETLRAAFDGTGLEVKRLFWWGGWMVPLLRRMRSKSTGSSGSVSKTYADYLRLPPWPAPFLMSLAYAWEERRAIEGRVSTGSTLFAVGVREE